MEIREFAERILLGKSLSEKLLQADHFEDRCSLHQKPFPRFPNRPAGLSLERWHQTKRTAFPNVRNLENERQRGVILHFFANHELLALELIALALLKFPDAPSSFRLGLLNTLLEEQSHLRFYETRMRHYQVAFGEIPVNDFFWKCLAAMATPLDFVTGMSLTLEQANLDYALYYAKAFRQMGDCETADILDKVYEDEIGHVRHGLKWLQHWKTDQQNDWEAYRNALKFPLTPARAKGIDFNKEGRVKAGFSEHYIAELSLYAQSKGRVPGVFYFNPTCESEIAYGKAGWTPAKPVRQLSYDLRALPMFLARKDDIVLLEKRPSTAFLTKLQQVGFPLPEFVEIPPSVKPNSLQNTGLLERKIGRLQPWGWSPESAKFLAPLKKSAVALWDGRLQPFFSKTWCVQLLKDFLNNDAPDPYWQCDPDVVGHACFSFQQVEKAYHHFKEHGFEHIIVKANLGASGQNIVHLAAKHGLLKKKNWIEKLLKQQGSVVVEPWLDKVLDLSFQFDVSSEQKVSTLGLTRFFTDRRGQYRGSVVGRFDAGVDASLLKFLHYQVRGKQPKSLNDVFASLATKIATPLQQVGYLGPIGVDALVYRDPLQEETLRLKPVVEINPRFSMGRLSLALAKHLHHRHLGIWLILKRKEIQVNGFENFVDLAQTLERQFSLETTKSLKQKIKQGVLFTTDPKLAEGFASVLLVGRSLEECRQPLDQFLEASHPLR